MIASCVPWNAAEAKVNFGTLLDDSATGPQLILKRGTPSAVLVSYETWQKAEASWAPPLAKLLAELADIHSREGDPDPVVRADRPTPEFE